MADVLGAFETLVATIEDHVGDLRLAAAEAAMDGDYTVAGDQLEQAEAAEKLVRQVNALQQEWEENLAGREGERAVKPSVATSVAPDLTHTTVLEASFGSRNARNWNDLLRQAHREAMERLGSFRAVKGVTRSNIVKGERTEGGYTYLPDVDISIQGVQSNRAWADSERLARELDVPIRVIAERRKKVGDSPAGERIELVWPRELCR
ncbi:MAG: hypothetical protein ACOC6F_02230 [bacterium]